MKNFIFIFIFSLIGSLSDTCMAQDFSTLIAELERLDSLEEKDAAIPILEKAWKMVGKDPEKHIEALWYSILSIKPGYNEEPSEDSLSRYGLVLCEQSEKGKNHKRYHDFLDAAFQSNLGMEKFEIAHSFIDTMTTRYVADTSKYSIIIGQKALVFARENKKEQAFLYFEKFDTLRAKVKFKIETASILLHYSSFLTDNGKYNQSIQILKQTIEGLEKYHKYHSFLLSIAYNDLGLVYYYKKETTIGIEYLKKAGRLKKRENEINKAMGLYNIAATYVIEEATMIDSCLHYIKLLKSNIDSLDSSKKKELLDTRAKGLDVTFYYVLGNYDEAIEQGKALLHEIEVLIKNDKDSYSFSYLSTLNDIALSYSARNEPDSAIVYLNKALEGDKALLNDEIQYTLYGNLATAYSSKKDHKNALLYTEKAIELAAKIYDKNDPAYLYKEEELGVTLCKMKRVKEGLDLIQKAYKKTQSISPHSERLHIYQANMLSAYTYLKDKDSIFLYAQKVNDELQYQYQFVLPYLSAKTQNAFVAKDEKNSLCVYSAAYLNPKEIRISNISYDNAIFIKGRLLAYSLSWKQQLKNSKDLKIKDLYENWKEKRGYLAEQYALKMTDRDPKTDSIVLKIEQIENQLSQKSAAYRQAVEQVNWQKVQSQLKDREAAVEFIHFKLHNGLELTDSTMYCAMILKKGDLAPTLVPLFEEKTLDKMLPDSLNKTQKTYSYFPNDTYKMIWQPLEPFLTGIEHIYYAPSGKLDLIAFDALTYKDKQYLTQRYKTFRRLRSTRALYFGLDDGDLKLKSALCLSDVSYDENRTSIANSMAKNEKPTCGFAYLGENGQRNFAAVDSLTNFYKIENLNQKQGNATEIYYKNTISKESGSPEVLLFYTHGFYQEKPTFSERCALLSIKEPLFRSGLILANGNAAWCSNGKNNNSKEDNILTAYEIANMDLSNTKLVILAACQSGKGDLQGSEGIIGLQRAFKIAGAKNLLVALRDVDATYANFFITHFYQKTLTGQAPYEAYHATIKEAIESKHFGPNVWSAFVLVE